jgi:hypothetical protein
VHEFLIHHGAGVLDGAESITALKLLEMQRHAMLMYTSCGWFFDELSGIETVQVIQYAGRAIQLAQEIFGDALDAHFLDLLGKAKSNLSEHIDGRAIYGKFVKPAALDLEKVSAHYGISSLFEDYDKQTTLFSYTIDLEAYENAQAGRTKLALGRARVTSEITREAGLFCFGILYWGDHNISGCVRQCGEGEPPQSFVNEVMEVFSRADFPQTLHNLEGYFGSAQYSLKNLFRDEQRRILEIILQSNLDDIEGIYRQIYENHVPLMRFFQELGIPRPVGVSTAADYVLNVSLRRAFEEDNLDVTTVENLLDVAVLEGISFDSTTLEMAIRKKIEQLADQLLKNADQLPLLQKIEGVLGLTKSLPFQINLRNVQNRYFEILQRMYSNFQESADHGNKAARQWTDLFKSLGEQLSVKVD